jgi:hypothetical protein
MAPNVSYDKGTLVLVDVPVNAQTLIGTRRLVNLQMRFEKHCPILVLDFIVAPL